MITFRPAIRGSAKLLVGLYSESGCGKTLSALLLARGFVGPNGTIGMIETESGRGEAYADTLSGGYSVLSLRVGFFTSGIRRSYQRSGAGKIRCAHH